MADEQMGLFRALWRFVTFYGLRKQLGLVRAADRMFTGSTEGIGDAFDLHRDQLIRRYNDLFDAFGQLETVLEEKRLESEALVKELNQRLQGMQASIDRGPLDAVLQANRELAAKARVSERLSGTDVRAQDTEYADAGRSSSIEDEFGAMLSARKAEREAKTGTPP